MRVLILGGDGYLGWPTAMRFSARGHEVSLVDNFSRRAWHERARHGLAHTDRPLEDRIAAWQEVSGNQIRSYVGAIEDAPFLEEVIVETKPEAVIHYGEQASAPYSMASREQAVETQHTNVIGMLNLLFFAPRSRARLPPGQARDDGRVRTPNIDIEEGYIEIEHKGRRDTLPFPKLPGSLYHLSKVHDSHNIHFACRIWGLRSTDLNQGVVYGIETDETAQDERLSDAFDYDEWFGTVLNRFCVQAVVGHPLTVYGKGGQTAASSTSATPCSAWSWPSRTRRRRGEFRVFNQFTEQFSVEELAELVQHPAAELGSRSTSSTSTTRGSRPRSTTTTRSTPSCWTWG